MHFIHHRLISTRSSTQFHIPISTPFFIPVQIQTRLVQVQISHNHFHPRSHFTNFHFNSPSIISSLFNVIHTIIHRSKKTQISSNATNTIIQHIDLSPHIHTPTFSHIIHNTFNNFHHLHFKHTIIQSKFN